MHVHVCGDFLETTFQTTGNASNKIPKFKSFPCFLTLYIQSGERDRIGNRFYRVLAG